MSTYGSTWVIYGATSRRSLCVITVKVFTQWRPLVESLSQLLRLLGGQIGRPRLVTTRIAQRDGIEGSDRSNQTPCRYLRKALNWIFSLLKGCHSPT